MPKVKVGDINMYYEVHGEGEPLVFIAGLGGSISSFFLDIPAFSGKYKVVVFENRGAGRSDAPAVPYTMEMMSDDTAGLFDAIGIDNVHIFGRSMGGMIAQHFALRYPQRVRSLILIYTDCGGTAQLVRFLFTLTVASNESTNAFRLHCRPAVLRF